ncbi:Vacuolar protein-sorting-associated protein 36 [Nakaseomyces bracarensis]|uniref:Vacuolar protein-sorting-associated protein 36 n=1 Tax=Nakaseomyces bracarensis TaxID=273131 RepID=A0ABR4NT09_9SACH
MECWHFVETTESGQPLLRENEKDILIDHDVGLYHGKERIKHRQKGRIFLTSQRVLYVDSQNPQKYSMGIELDDIDHLNYSSGFLRRSARLIIFIDSSMAYIQTLMGLKKDTTITTTWICPICMVTNETQGELTATSSPTPVCVNCGVPADYELTKNSITINNGKHEKTVKDTTAKKENINSCPQCTFINHPQVGNCEICGARLPNSKIRNKIRHTKKPTDSRLVIELESLSSNKTNRNQLENYIQISFRKSDGLLFADALEKAVTDLKANNIYNQNCIKKGTPTTSEPLPLLETKLSKIGITSLEKSREAELLNNDILFTSALTDLDKLISLADSIERLYRKEEIRGHAPEQSNLLIDRDTFYNREQFISEISREIYDFVKNGFKNEKNKDSYVMITLVDLYALYNKSMRIGTGLISPEEMREACERFSNFDLRDLYLTKINGRVLCVCTNDAFEYIKEKILKVIEEKPGSDLLSLSQILNSDSSNTWSVGIIQEMLKSCVDKGDLVIDEQISGIGYYTNVFWGL